MSAEPNRGALPAYLRIAERLTIEIGAGRLRPGDKLPPEREMAEIYGVSNMTLRKALAIVTQRGLIARRQGSGNYVEHDPKGQRRDVGTYALFRLEAVPDGGGLPTAELLTFGPLVEDAPAGLGPALRLRRLRRLDDVPVAVEEIWLDTRYGDLTEADVSESLYRTYEKVLNLRIGRADDRVTVSPCPRWAPKTLGIMPECMMGLVERRSFDQYGALAEVSRTWFDPGRARYYARVP